VVGSNRAFDCEWIAQQLTKALPGEMRRDTSSVMGIACAAPGSLSACGP
jgi:hypothetical protein